MAKVGKIEIEASVLVSRDATGIINKLVDMHPHVADEKQAEYLGLLERLIDNHMVVKVQETSKEDAVTSGELKG